MRPAIPCWWVALMTVALPGPTVIWPVGLRADQTVTRPFAGVTCITRTETLPRILNLHVVQIDLTTPGLRFKLSPPGGTRDTVRQTTLDFLRQEHAQLAINAHFYLPFATPDTDANLVGFAVSEGFVYSPFEPQPIGPAYADQSYAIVAYAPALNIDRFNHARIVHADPADPDHRRVRETTPLWTAVAGSAQIVTQGVKTIPSYTGVAGGLKTGAGYWDGNSWYAALRARTAIGLTADNRTLVLFTADETGGSPGMTVSEMADLLIHDYQVYDALNLDGDGSTSMAMEDPVSHRGRLVNVPSDGALGRGVGSNLAVFAPPSSAGINRLTLTLAAADAVIAAWPADGLGWELERTSTLVPGIWTKVHLDPKRVDDHFQMTLPNGNTGVFYRLVR